MAAPGSGEEFLDLVRKSGVVDEKRLDTYAQQLRAAGSFPDEPGKFAGLMVRDGLLTHFQAEQFLLGKWRRFTIGKYKVLPEAYKTCAKFLQLDPGECCMVACHNFDLNAGKACGYRTAFVRRPDEWGADGPPDPEPDPRHDIAVRSFPELAEKLEA